MYNTWEVVKKIKQIFAFDNVSIFDLVELLNAFEGKKKTKGWIGACRRELITPILTN